MIQHSPTDPAAAIAQIPGGIFVLTANSEGRRGAVLVKWVQQCSDQPPMVMVALGKGQAVEPLIRNSRSFALCQISPDDRFVLHKLSGEQPENEDPLISMMTRSAPSGSPVLERALTYLDCEVVRHIELESEHRIYVGQVHHGGLLNGRAPHAAERSPNGHNGAPLHDANGERTHNFPIRDPGSAA